MKFYFITTEKLDIAEEYIGCLAKTDVSKIDQDDDFGYSYVDYEDGNGIGFYTYFGEYCEINKLSNLLYYKIASQSSDKEIKEDILNFVIQVLMQKNVEFPNEIVPYSVFTPIKFFEKIKQSAFDMLVEKYGKIDFLKQSVKEEYKYTEYDPADATRNLYFNLWILSERFGKTDDPEKFFEWFKQI